MIDKLIKNIWRNEFYQRLTTALAVAIFAVVLVASPTRAIMGGEGLMWLVSPDDPVRLVVCWEKPSDADPTASESVKTSGALRREWVRLAVKNSWERYARVVFSGWETCRDENNATPSSNQIGPSRPGTKDENIKIAIAFSGESNNWGHGSYGDYQQSGVLLNLHCANTASELSKCIRSTAIHEFGHVLGFMHEEERSDWPSTIAGCPPQSYAPSPPWWPIPTELQFGEADRDSVMAYCSGSPLNLSHKDIAGVQSYYGRHIPGSLVSVPGSLCLSGKANTVDGEAVFGWECDEDAENQEWHYETYSQSLHLAVLAHWRCLDVDTSTNEYLQTWDCNGQAQQKWGFRNLQIRGYGGLCLVRPTSGIAIFIAAANNVSMEKCAELPSGAEVWQMEKAHPGGGKQYVRFVADGTDLCLTADNVLGSQVKAVTCANSGKIAEQQLFLLRSGGQIQLKHDHNGDALCLDIWNVLNSSYLQGNGGPEEGAIVQVFTCLTNQLNQSWNFTGNVVNGSQCLTIAADGSKNGQAAYMESCDGTILQVWDYYP